MAAQLHGTAPTVARFTRFHGEAEALFAEALALENDAALYDALGRLHMAINALDKADRLVKRACRLERVGR